MALTTAQLQTLKADILADPVLSAYPNTSDGNYAIAAAYNVAAAPSFTVWKTNVPLVQIGDAMVATEIAGMTSLNLDRLRTMATYGPDGINPSLADRRAFFDDIFSGAGGQLTRPKLLALWKRLALRGEKLFATGTGSDATPATLVVEGQITTADVEEARR